MSGSSHDRRVADRAADSALDRLGLRDLIAARTVDASTIEPPSKQLGRSSIEAYAFFLMAGFYTVTSAFGSPVNFVAGCVVAVAMAVCAAHLLWRSIWTANWAKMAKYAGSTLIVLTLLIVINHGYVQTHRAQDPNAETLSAIQNLRNLISNQSREPIVQTNNTQVFEVDDKYPDIELGDPRDVTNPNGPPLANTDEKNVGNGTAFSKRESAGLFFAPTDVAASDKIFRFLYKIEHDTGDKVPSEDVAPGGGGIVPVGGPVLEEDGTEVNDADRRAFFEKTKALYIAILVGYQGRNGHVFHKELCYYYREPQSLPIKCTRHNGHG